MSTLSLSLFILYQFFPSERALDTMSSVNVKMDHSADRRQRTEAVLAAANNLLQQKRTNPLPTNGPMSTQASTGSESHHMKALSVAWSDGHPDVISPSHAERHADIQTQFGGLANPSLPPSSGASSSAPSGMNTPASAVTTSSSANTTPSQSHTHPFGHHHNSSISTAAAITAALTTPAAASHTLHPLRPVLPHSNSASSGSSSSLVPTSTNTSPGLSSSNAIQQLQSSTSSLLATFNQGHSGSGTNGSASGNVTPAKAKLNQFILDLVKNQIRITDDFSAMCRAKLREKDQLLHNLQLQLHQLSMEKDTLSSEYVLVKNELAQVKRQREELRMENLKLHHQQGRDKLNSQAAPSQHTSPQTNMPTTSAATDTLALKASYESQLDLALLKQQQSYESILSEMKAYIQDQEVEITRVENEIAELRRDRDETLKETKLMYEEREKRLETRVRDAEARTNQVTATMEEVKRTHKSSAGGRCCVTLVSTIISTILLTTLLFIGLGFKLEESTLPALIGPILGLAPRVQTLQSSSASGGVTVDLSQCPTMSASCTALECKPFFPPFDSSLCPPPPTFDLLTMCPKFDPATQCPKQVCAECKECLPLECPSLKEECAPCTSKEVPQEACSTLSQLLAMPIATNKMDQESLELVHKFHQLNTADADGDVPPSVDLLTVLTAWNLDHTTLQHVMEQLKTLELERQKWSTEEKTLKLRIEELTAELAQQSSNTNQLSDASSADLVTLRTQFVNLTTEHTATVEELEATRAELSKLRETHAASVEQVDELVKKLEEATQATMQNDEEAKEKDEAAAAASSNEIASLAESLTELHTLTSQLTDELQHNKVVITQLTDENTELSTLNSELTAEVAHWNTTAQEWEVIAKDFEERAAEVRKEMEEVRAVARIKKENDNTKKKEEQDVSAVSSTPASVVSAASSSSVDVDSLTTPPVSSSVPVNASLLAEVGMLHDLLANLTAQHTLALSELETARTEMEEAKSADLIDELTQLTERLELLTKTNDELIADKASFQAEIATLKSQLANATAASTPSEAEAEAAESNSELIQKYELLRQREEEHGQELRALQEKFDQLSQADVTSTKYAEEIAVLKNEIEELRSTAATTASSTILNTTDGTVDSESDADFDSVSQVAQLQKQIAELRAELSVAEGLSTNSEKANDETMEELRKMRQDLADLVKQTSESVSLPVSSSSDSSSALKLSSDSAELASLRQEVASLKSTLALAKEGLAAGIASVRESKLADAAASKRTQMLEALLTAISSIAIDEEATSTSVLASMLHSSLPSLGLVDQDLTYETDDGVSLGFGECYAGVLESYFNFEQFRPAECPVYIHSTSDRVKHVKAIVDAWMEIEHPTATVLMPQLTKSDLDAPVVSLSPPALDRNDSASAAALAKAEDTALAAVEELRVLQSKYIQLQDAMEELRHESMSKLPSESDSTINDSDPSSATSTIATLESRLRELESELARALNATSAAELAAEEAREQLKQQMAEGAKNDSSFSFSSSPIPLPLDFPPLLPPATCPTSSEFAETIALLSSQQSDFRLLENHVRSLSKMVDRRLATPVIDQETGEVIPQADERLKAIEEEAKELRTMLNNAIEAQQQQLARPSVSLPSSATRSGNGTYADFPRSLDELREFSFEVSQAFLTFDLFELQYLPPLHRIVTILIYVIIDVTLFQFLLPRTRIWMTLVMFLWMGLTVLCTIQQIWIGVVLGAMNTMLTCIMICKPNAALYAVSVSLGANKEDEMDVLLPPKMNGVNGSLPPLPSAALSPPPPPSQPAMTSPPSALPTRPPMPVPMSSSTPLTPQKPDMPMPVPMPMPNPTLTATAQSAMTMPMPMPTNRMPTPPLPQPSTHYAGISSTLSPMPPAPVTSSMPMPMPVPIMPESQPSSSSVSPLVPIMPSQITPTKQDEKKEPTDLSSTISDVASVPYISPSLSMPSQFDRSAIMNPPFLPPLSPDRLEQQTQQLAKYILPTPSPPDVEQQSSSVQHSADSHYPPFAGDDHLSPPQSHLGPNHVDGYTPIPTPTHQSSFARGIEEQHQPNQFDSQFNSQVNSPQPTPINQHSYEQAMNMARTDQQFDQNQPLHESYVDSQSSYFDMSQHGDTFADEMAAVPPASSSQELPSHSQTQQSIDQQLDHQQYYQDPSHQYDLVPTHGSSSNLVSDETSQPQSGAASGPFSSQFDQEPQMHYHDQDQTQPPESHDSVSPPLALPSDDPTLTGATSFSTTSHFSMPPSLHSTPSHAAQVQQQQQQNQDQYYQQEQTQQPIEQQQSQQVQQYSYDSSYDSTNTSSSDVFASFPPQSAHAANENGYHESFPPVNAYLSGPTPPQAAPAPSASFDDPDGAAAAAAAAVPTETASERKKKQRKGFGFAAAAAAAAQSTLPTYSDFPSFSSAPIMPSSSTSTAPPPPMPISSMGASSLPPKPSYAAMTAQPTTGGSFESSMDGTALPPVRPSYSAFGAMPSANVGLARFPTFPPSNAE